MEFNARLAGWYALGFQAPGEFDGLDAERTGKASEG